MATAHRLSPDAGTLSISFSQSTTEMGGKDVYMKSAVGSGIKSSLAQLGARLVLNGTAPKAAKPFMEHQRIADLITN